MTQLIWDDTGKRLFETGLDRCVLYVMDPNGAYPLGVAWNGLLSLTESPSGAEPSPLFGDNLKYLTLISAEDFTATLEAYTYPEEFDECDGSKEVAVGSGGRVSQQPRKKFGLVYRTKLGNDVAGQELGYKLHLVYGCLASPSEKAYSTINDSPEAITFSWEIATTPTNVTGFQPTSIIVIDSTKCTLGGLTDLENQLFGAVGIVPNLPSPNSVKTILETASDWYVDSVNGSDNNSGRTSLQAFSTIAKLLTVMAAGEKIGLARGSEWREEIIYPGSGCAYVAYGMGADPILRCDDVAPNVSFTKTDGQTNVYQVTLSPDLVFSGTWNSVWEDDIRLIRAPSLAICDSTPGSYFPSSETISPITMYIHASDGSNIFSNAKVYEYAKRQCGARGPAGDGYTVGLNGLDCRRPLGEGGAIRVGPHSFVFNCYSREGNKHNIYVRTGCWVENVSAIEAYYAGASSTMYVFNENSPNGEGVTFLNCVAQVSDGTGFAISGFYGHYNIGGNFGTVLYDQCSCINTAGGFGGNHAAIVVRDCAVTNCAGGVTAASEQTSFTMTGTTISIPTVNGTGMSIQTGCGPVIVDDCLFIVTGTRTSQAAIQCNPTDVDLTITNTTFQKVVYATFFYTGASGGTVNVSGCYFNDVVRGYDTLTGGPTITSDYNRISSAGQDNRIQETLYNDIASYQAATLQDLHSTIG